MSQSHRQPELVAICHHRQKRERKRHHLCGQLTPSSSHWGITPSRRCLIYSACYGCLPSSEQQETCHVHSVVAGEVQTKVPLPAIWVHNEAMGAEVASSEYAPRTFHLLGWGDAHFFKTNQYLLSFSFLTGALKCTEGVKALQRGPAREKERGPLLPTLTPAPPSNE